MDIKAILKKYDKKNITIAVLGSHSALDVCRGVKALNLHTKNKDKNKTQFKTLVICEKGREKTYDKYYRTRGELGCVDDVIVLDKFSDITNKDIQNELKRRNSIFIPHRSFEVYIHDYNKIEREFQIPMFGNRYLLKSEERNVKPNQYDILRNADIRFPKQYKNPKQIDRLSIVKVLQKKIKHERAFFLASSEKDFIEMGNYLIKKGKITEQGLHEAVIEEYIVGVQVNFNFFFDPLNNRLELLGTDTRRQTNIEGYNKVPYFEYNKVREHYGVQHEEAGHIAVTVLESMLEKAFDIGERFVRSTQELSEHGVIGPFGLQSMIVPSPKGKDIIVFDVSPRMPGSPGIFATPYGYYLHGMGMSAGLRVAIQIKEALDADRLQDVLT